MKRPKNTPLEQLLMACTVRVDIVGKKDRGTGFFVAPGYVLTCLHVVAEAKAQALSVEIVWRGARYPAQIQKCLPESLPDKSGNAQGESNSGAQYPDLALLSVSKIDIDVHPCVY